MLNRINKLIAGIASLVIVVLIIIPAMHGGG